MDKGRVSIESGSSHFVLHKTKPEVDLISREHFPVSKSTRLNESESSYPADDELSDNDTTVTSTQNSSESEKINQIDGINMEKKRVSTVDKGTQSEIHFSPFASYSAMKNEDMNDENKFYLIDNIEQATIEIDTDIVKYSNERDSLKSTHTKDSLNDIGSVKHSKESDSLKFTQTENALSGTDTVKHSKESDSLKSNHTKDSLSGTETIKHSKESDSLKSTHMKDSLSGTDTVKYSKESDSIKSTHTKDALSGTDTAKHSKESDSLKSTHTKDAPSGTDTAKYSKESDSLKSTHKKDSLSSTDIVKYSKESDSLKSKHTKDSLSANGDELNYDIKPDEIQKQSISITADNLSNSDKSGAINAIISGEGELGENFEKDNLISESSDDEYHSAKNLKLHSTSKINKNLVILRVKSHLNPDGTSSLSVLEIEGIDGVQVVQFDPLLMKGATPGVFEIYIMKEESPSGHPEISVQIGTVKIYPGLDDSGSEFSEKQVKNAKERHTDFLDVIDTKSAVSDGDAKSTQTIVSLTADTIDDLECDDSSPLEFESQVPCDTESLPETKVQDTQILLETEELESHGDAVLKEIVKPILSNAISVIMAELNLPHMSDEIERKIREDNHSPIRSSQAKDVIVKARIKVEEEIRPIRQELLDLQHKVRDLNLPQFHYAFTHQDYQQSSATTKATGPKRESQLYNRGTEKVDSLIEFYKSIGHVPTYQIPTARNVAKSLNLMYHLGALDTQLNCGCRKYPQSAPKCSCVSNVCNKCLVSAAGLKYQNRLSQTYSKFNELNSMSNQTDKGKSSHTDKEIQSLAMANQRQSSTQPLTATALNQYLNEMQSGKTNFSSRRVEKPKPSNAIWTEPEDLLGEIIKRDINKIPPSRIRKS